MHSPSDDPQEHPSDRPQPDAAAPQLVYLSSGIAASPKRPRDPAFFRNLRELLDMIKFEHTVFALPFALLGAMATARGLPPLAKVLWILAAMVGARTAAMTFNRLADQDLDGDNPRTRERALPAGRVSRAGAMALLGAAVVLFGYAAGQLGPLPWKLVPLALLVILGYSFCKRFTLLSHAVLGLSLAGAPLGAWIAVNGKLDPPAWCLALGVLTWTAGFDILYACQDYTADIAGGLHSIPARLGIPLALCVARLTHLLSVALLILLGFATPQFHTLYFVGVGLAIVLLCIEHAVARADDLSRINLAFFTLNGFISLVLGTLGIIDALR